MASAGVSDTYLNPLKGVVFNPVGEVWYKGIYYDLTEVSGTVAVAADTIVKAAVPSRTITVFSYDIQKGSANSTVYFRNGVGGVQKGVKAYGINNVEKVAASGAFCFRTTTNTALVLSTSGAQEVAYSFAYAELPL